MTTFDPSLAALDRPDHLGGALQQGLPRPMNPNLTWGLVRTFFLSGITGGILPTIFLPKRFRNFASAEQLQFWHLAEWLRLQTGDSDAAAATEAAKRVRPGIWLRMASLAFVIVAMGIACSAVPHNGSRYGSQTGSHVGSHYDSLVPRWFALTLPDLNPVDLKSPLSVSAFDEQGHRVHEQWHEDWDQFNRHESAHVFLEGPTDKWFRIYHPGETSGAEPLTDSTSSDGASSTGRTSTISLDLVNAFALAMTGAALCWLIEINTHIGRVRRFVGAFNQLSGRYGVGPVRAPGVQLGLRPLWLLGGLATCALGGFWAVPVMMAAGAHGRYIKTVSQRLRSDLARRQREVLLTKRPPIRVPASSHLMGICPRENCRAPFPPEAAFCRRCGTKLEA